MLLGCSIEWEGKVMASRIQVLTPYRRIQAYLVNVGNLILCNNLGITSVIAARSEQQVGGSRKGTETSEADRCTERIQRSVDMSLPVPDFQSGY
jgi:membrane protein YdbS with pleckstrin-like domain